jgi:hypothetical protein
VIPQEFGGLLEVHALHELDEIDSSATAESLQADTAIEPSVIVVPKAAGVDFGFVVRARPDPFLIPLVALEACKI